MSNLWTVMPLTHEGQSTKEMWTICYGIYKDLKKKSLSKMQSRKGKKIQMWQFVEKRYLAMHMKRQHTAPKRYRCICGINIAYSCSLNRYLKTCKLLPVSCFTRQTVEQFRPFMNKCPAKKCIWRYI